MLIAICSLSANLAMAQRDESQDSPPLDSNLGIQTVALWNTANGRRFNPDEQPFLTAFYPAPGKANGTGVIIAPGGSYRTLASNLEGRQIADWFTVRGISAFVLKYRVGDRNLYPIPLQDAQRAIRVIRSDGQKYKVRINRLGIVGFSAGGHLAAMAATSFDDGDSKSTDPVERVSDRPDFLIVGYPWLNAMQPKQEGYITYCSVLKISIASQCKSFEQYTPSAHVTGNTPPTFIYTTDDDRIVPVAASVAFFSSLHSANVPVEMHIFRHGKHGSGLGSSDAALDIWPALLESWLRDLGFLNPMPAMPTEVEHQ
jgi:acetyl esterase/lipase